MASSNQCHNIYVYLYAINIYYCIARVSSTVFCTHNHHIVSLSAYTQRSCIFICYSDSTFYFIHQVFILSTPFRLLVHKSRFIGILLGCVPPQSETHEKRPPPRLSTRKKDKEIPAKITITHPFHSKYIKRRLPYFSIVVGNKRSISI